MAIDSRGRIVVGGTASPLGLHSSFPMGYALARFLPDGRSDRSFGGGGNLLTSEPGDVYDTGQVLSGR